MSVFRSNAQHSDSVLSESTIAARRYEIAARHRAAHNRTIIAAYEARKAAYQARLAAEAEAEAALIDGSAQLAELAQPLDPYIRVMVEGEVISIIKSERLHLQMSVDAQEADYLRQERDAN